MQDFYKQLVVSLSQERLQKYYQILGSNSKIETVLAYYTLNKFLSESLYPVIQTCEITLRNQFHSALSDLYSSDSWYDIPNVLDNRGRQNIRKAKDSLTKQKKQHTSGAIVAELTLGFWESLSNSSYDVPIFRKIVKRCFPNTFSSNKSRKVISPKLHRFRKLRNRIFHHEPVWYDSNLNSKHDEIIELIGWMSPAAKLYITEIDRFYSISRNINTYEELLNRANSKYS